ncbi:phage regulatory CII family protein [Marichromatium gracile]|uniref:Phage regulatory protein CII n=1 Tax=Marichromatium gracile TaxID=1048 RepID=A0A4R4A5C7_MARGR|nr:phage regulatory CII family protein [Marichromatium gracile]MBK1709822.1 hypothetical protein [Marichromatium gracile]TCW32667.1 hypothetical protein EDC29_11733 [Marichromatium gracile]
MHDPVETAISEMAGGYKPGGYVGLAKAIDRNPGTFFNQFTFQERNQPGINTLRAAMRVTGNHGPLHALCHEFGYGLIALGEYQDCSDTDLIDCLTALGAARGEVDAEVHRANADRRITREEALRVRARAMEAIRANLELLSRLDALAEAETQAEERRALRAVGGA